MNASFFPDHEAGVGSSAELFDILDLGVQGTELRFQGFFDISGNIFEKLIVIHRWLSSFCVVVQARARDKKAPDGGLVHHALCKKLFNDNPGD